MDFIDREAKVVTDELYGEIQSFSVGGEGKGKATSFNNKVTKRIPQKGRSFVTAINPLGKEVPDPPAKRTSVVTASAFEKPCLFCQKNHKLESCGKFVEVLFQRKNLLFKVKWLMLWLSDIGSS